MLSPLYCLPSLTLCSAVALLPVTPVLAQLELTADTAPDRTLGTQVQQNVIPGIDVITGGTRPQNGQNLFHSFQEFNIRENRGAYFQNPVGVSNILTRVTGNDPSDILGTLGVLGNANLFFINPNGIIFGRNASLDLGGGSFYGTTASGIKFGDVGEFSAVNPQPPSNLLTINPSAFFFTARPAGAIVNQSQATQTVLGDTTFGLVVLPNQRLLLLGGDVILDGGRLAALGGRVEIGSVTGPGTVRLDANGSLTVPQGLQRGDVLFVHGARVLVRFRDAGDIAIIANNINILDGSRLLAGIAQGFGTPTSQAGDITFDAAGLVQVVGETSVIENNVNRSATGNSGNLRIMANTLEVRDGAQLQAVTLGTGNAGNVIIEAQDRVLFNNGAVAFSSVEAGARGKGGSVQISTNTLEVLNGAQLAASTLGTGDSGNVVVEARGQVSFNDRAAVLNRVEQTGRGQGGDIIINSASLSVSGGSQLSVTTFGEGNGGDVKVRVTDHVSFDGFFNDLSSGIRANIDQENTVQNSGNIFISAGSLSVTNGAQITATVFGRGQAGSIVLDVRDAVVLDGFRITDEVESSGLFTRVAEEGEGQGGNITVFADSMTVGNGAQLSASTQGIGNGGNITLNIRDAILLKDGGSLISNVSKSGVGDAGDINIITGSLYVINAGGSALQTTTFGLGNAGNIIIDAHDEVIFSNISFLNSRVAEGAKGRGGNVQISTNSLEILNGSQLASSTESIGDAGNVVIKARDRVLFNGGNVFSSVEAKAEGKGGNVQIYTNSLEVLNGSQLLANTLGIGDAGNVMIEASDDVLFNGTSTDGLFASTAFSNVAAGAQGKGGDVRISTNTLEVLDGAQLIASTAGRGNAGDVVIEASDGVKFNNRGSASSGVEAGAQGKGGNVQIFTGSLEVLNGAQLIASTLGTGDAGNVVIKARDSVVITGASPVFGFSSALFTSTLTDGQGGNIIINTRAFQILEGAVVDARTTAAGSSGNVAINASTIDILNGGQVLAITQGSGRAGSITVNAFDRFTISGTDPTYATRSTQFEGRVAPVSESSGIFVRSQGTGGAGDITITAPQIRMNQGVISAESAEVDGGNINLNVRQLLLMRNGSLISASAGTDKEGGNGGNITINAPNGFIVGVKSENSDITANAFTGSGGRVNITAQGIFGLEFRPNLTPFSDITASSSFGASGIVTLNTPNIDPNRGLTQLPQNLVDTNRILANSCIVRDTASGGTFLITGSGGLPVRPGDAPLPSFSMGEVQGVAESQASVIRNPKSKIENGDPIVEAQGIYRLPDGQIILSWECRK